MTNFWDLAHHAWHIIFAGVALLLAVVAAGHAVLYKRDSRAAIAWVGFIWLAPIVGALVYFVFGVNRLRRHAAVLRGALERYQSPAAQIACLPEELHHHLPGHTGHLMMLARVVGGVVDRPLLTGNLVEPLINGDEAYPAMLEAIAGARRSISFLTYIFDRDEVGLEFARVLGEAKKRGVEVRVLIDAAGTRYSWPSILPALKHRDVRCARFLPLLGLGLVRLLSMNLRTHRKIVVVDGEIGFTGGINIRVGHCLRRQPRSPVQDMHFRVKGPIVAQLQEAFADDWMFTTGEALRGELWFPEPHKSGPVLSRAVIDGPDEDFEKLRWTLLGALAIARYSVQIVTPYFLPDPAVVSALNLAAMRGVKVDILLPSRSNLPFVQWASRAMWWQVLEHGCRIWLTPPPFDHSKLMLVDGCWVLLGSANWDARSLRLNFELNVECYDVELARKLERILETKRVGGELVTLADVDGRSVPARLRDGLARLLTPYL
ncbi:MAG TPA: phospholipase D-like domain-containing protein [Candidatus Limnocylindrales bacterium]|nr:phospholipase D-like domain-containing protein [Candidatus Limnocylindrales bacterium]